MRPVRLAPEVVAELFDAVVWYESREQGLGARFLDEVERVLPSLAARPRSFPRLLDTTADIDVRRALLPRYPFALVFVELAAEVRVLAVAHARRRPNYWLYRVRP
jgi:plasmid stabilization system protein ParE